MGRERGWVSVSVRTYHSHRNSSQQQQRVLQQEYTVDESGATLNAVSRSSDMREEERAIMQMAQSSSSTPTTSIFIRDWKLSGRRAYIRYERDDSSFWFNPVIDEHRPSSSTPGFPCNRGDIFLKLGMRGARLIPWRLREGDVFRLGQAYVLVAKVRTAADVEMDVSSLSPFDEAAAAAERASQLEDGEESDEEGGSRREKDAPQCYICYEEGERGNPLINPCQCAGSVKYVHLNCLQRWIQPEGSSAVNTHCPVCKARYPEKTQAMMHGTASLGRFTDHNDVVIPDHSVSGEHALIVHANDEFWLHDRESSNGSFIRLCAPLRLPFGESWHLKMGKSLLQLQAKRSRWLRLRMRLNLLRLGATSEDESRHARGSGADRDCLPPTQQQQRTIRSWSMPAEQDTANRPEQPSSAAAGVTPVPNAASSSSSS